MDNMELYQTDNYRILGNKHTVEQFYKRHINGETIKKMVGLSVERMEIQKTYAIINGDIKLLVLRINTDTYFIITCLDINMHVKRGTLKIFV